MVQRQQRRINEFKTTDQQGREKRFAERERDARVKRQQEEIERNKKRVQQQSSSQNLSSQSSPEQKKESASSLFDSISELLFDKLNLINSTGATAGSTTSTSNYSMGLRLIDTTQRNFMRPDRKLRFRCTFYLTNGSKSLGYVLVPAVYSSLTAPTNVSQLDSYVGIKIDAGEIMLVSKDSKGEHTISTRYDVSDGDTYYLEIKYNITNAEIYIDGKSLGTTPCNLSGNLYDYLTFYPLIAPIKSKDGTSVNITFESYQILQDK